MRAAGRRTVFISNNPTRSPEAYAARLTRLGIPTSAQNILTSSQVLVDFLSRQMPGARLFVAGEAPLCNELLRAGFELTEDAGQVDVVIASFDRTFDYRKLQIAFDALRSGARFFATNIDRYCPVPGGGEPDAAAIIASFEACSGRKVESAVGKPSQIMIESILGLLRLPPAECLITGDRLETDVQMGLNAGIDTALVLTGATDRAVLAASTIQPTYVLETLNDLIPAQ